MVPLLFAVYINNLVMNVGGVISTFADATEFNVVDRKVVKIYNMILINW